MIKEFEMTNEQLKELMNACKPTPVMYMTGGVQMFKTPQDNANHAWELLGKELGFKHMTVRPIDGKDTKFFKAESTEV